nr:hypothetical protein [Methyloceanibacter superfactus]
MKAPSGPCNPTWAPARKDIVGASLGSSRLWFTIAQGIVTEVYYPRIDIPQIKDLGFIIADDEGFWVELRRIEDYTVTLPKAGARRRPSFIATPASPSPRRCVPPSAATRFCCATNWRATPASSPMPSSPHALATIRRTTWPVSPAMTDAGSCGPSKGRSRWRSRPSIKPGPILSAAVPSAASR